MRFEFRARLWLHSGEGGWHFVTLPPELGADIAEMTADARRGFGSLRVTAEIARISWATSIFPDSASRSFVLPVKKAIRQGAGIDDGDEVGVAIMLRDI